MGSRFSNVCYLLQTTMKASRWRWQVGFGFAIVLGAAMACGSGDNKSGFDNGDKDGGSTTTGGGGDGGGPTFGNGEGGIGFGGGTFNASTFALTPATTTLDLTAGADAGAAGMVQLEATDNGAALSGALFDIADRGELGSIGPSTGLFTASGTLGGTVTVEATYMGAKATATIAIVMHQTQNGATDALTAAPPNGQTAVNAFGPGGYGGVGGDGSGGAVTGAQQSALDAATGADGGGGGDGAAWLYPYANTMFPRGILAPLLQWSIGSSGDYQAVKIMLSEPGLQYTGYFARPFLAKAFGDVPIPADVWTRVYSSYTSATAKEDLQISVALLPKTGAAFSLPTRTVHIAGGSLRGKIYYQSYNTQLATSDVKDINNNYFGGATLAISPGASAPDPTPAAGDDNPGHSSTSCRVCHSVALSGSALVTQDGTAYNNSIFYNLAATTSAPVSGVTGSAFPAVTPDGTRILTSTLPIKGHTTPPPSSSFFSVPAGTAVPFANLPANLQAFLPAFSADGTKVAYTDGTGGPESGGALTVSPVDLVGKTFGTPKPLYTPAMGSNAYWPSFMPASDGVVFENELVSNGRDYAGTRPNGDSGNNLLIGPHGELWYVNLGTGKATRLDNANGDGYLPPHASATAADVNNDPVFNYEPTVNPVVSGGYAWIVFTSRRLYGNVATISPFASDPRNLDLSHTPTPKKLWVAAIDLSSDGTSDRSFPAFYLPGQELLAGNGRAFWVVEPCQADDTSCETGDQCCGGYCQPSGDGGALVCSDVKPTCSAEYDKCQTASDCCDTGLECIGGRCSVSAPR